MGYYENIKCGNCGYSFTDGYVGSNGLLKTYMGVPYIKCTKCNSVNKTGFKPYSTFHWIEKIYHWFSIIFRYTVFGLIFGILGAGLFHKFIIGDENYIDNISIIIVCIAIIAMISYAIKTEVKEIEEVEDEYRRMT